jgi:hypothetical protein
MMEEHRRFTRIIYSTPVTIKADDNMWSTQLIDVSLKGVLVKTPQQWNNQLGDRFILSFQLIGADIDIVMKVHKAHERNSCIGFTCDSIDIDSASHLRRLVELNVGHSDLLNRELEHLTFPVQ